MLVVALSVIDIFFVMFKLTLKNRQEGKIDVKCFPYSYIVSGLMLCRYDFFGSINLLSVMLS